MRQHIKISIKRTLTLTLVVFLFINVPLKMNGAQIVLASAPPLLSVDPPAIVDASLTPGSNFAVDINVTQVPDLYGFEFKLGYDTQFLTAENITLGDFFPPNSWIWWSSIDDEAGFAWYSVTMPLGSTQGVSGNGTLAVIDFTVDDYGYSDLVLYDTMMGNTGGYPIYHDLAHGFFANVPVPPIASFTYSPSEPLPNEVITFNASTSRSVIPGGYITSYEWDFGDGTTKKYIEGVNLTDTTTHSYPAINDYEVNLTVTDNQGYTDSETKLVSVISPAIASFTYSPSEPLPNEVITFNASTSRSVTGAPIVSYEWDFGDGNITTVISTTVTHTYNTKGDYNVTLTVTDSDGYQDSETKLLSVISPGVYVNPTSGPVGTKVTVKGYGFNAIEWGELYFDDHFLTYNILTDATGRFTATFNVPLSEPGPHAVKAYFYYVNPWPQTTIIYNQTTFTVIDTTLLEVKIDVGAIHFRGEIAEFYIQTIYKGVPVNITNIKATLYKPDGSFQTLPTTIVSTGLYKGMYPTQSDAQTGSYAIAVEANYLQSTINSSGASLKSFLISPTLTSENALIVDIKDEIATIIIPEIGTIRANLTAINAKLVSIDGRMATIETDIGTIKTDVRTINATLVSIEGRVATIETDMGTIKTDISDINAKITSIEGNTVTITSDLGTLKQEIGPASFQIGLATVVFSLLAAIGAILSVVLLRMKKTAG